METLPPEITSEVIRYISKRDMKAMRMVSRRFHDISSQLLFSRVYASIHQQDLVVLHKISSHPVLRLAAQEVVYSGVYFLTPPPEDKTGSSEASLDHYYCDRFQEQAAALEDKTNAPTISAALERMPNVRRVIVTNHWRPTRDFFSHATSETRFLGTVNIPDDARFGGPLHREYPLSVEKPCGDPLYIKDKDSGDIDFDYGLLVMCEAVSIARTPVQELAIDYYDGSLETGHIGLSYMCQAVSTAGTPAQQLVVSYNGGSLDAGHRGLTAGISPGSLGLLAGDLERSCSAFRHLRKIAFSLCYAKNDREWDILMQGNLAMLLTAANDLEELTLDFTSPLNEIPLTMCVGTHSWPRLRLLRLLRTEIQEAELTGLLCRHRKTLRALHLEDVTLMNGTWQGAATKWRRRLNLESVTCHELWEGEESGGDVMVRCDELRNYILHGKSGPIIDPKWHWWTSLGASSPTA